MHVSINGPELRSSQCDSLIAETVKTWLAQPRRKIARGKEGNAVKRVDVAVQAEIGENDTVTQPDMDLSQTRLFQPRMKPTNFTTWSWKLLLQFQ